MKPLAYDLHPYVALDAHRQLGIIMIIILIDDAMIVAHGTGMCHRTQMLAVPRITHLLNCQHNKSCAGQVICLGTHRFFMSETLSSVNTHV